MGYVSPDEEAGYSPKPNLSDFKFAVNKLAKKEQLEKEKAVLLNAYEELKKSVKGEINYTEILKALKNEDGRKIIANYGLDPKLGKYHRTYCEKHPH